MTNFDKEKFLRGMSERTLMFFSPTQLDIISNKTIALPGLGGIGAMVLELLVRLGVRRFRLLDMDKYELSNLNRQIIATHKTLGLWKVEAAATRIKEINPYAEIEMLIKEKANKKNVELLVKGADIVILGTDLPSSILLFHEYAKKFRVPLIDGHCVSVIGGSVQVFDYRNPRQVCRDRLFRSPILNAIAHKLLASGEKIAELSDEDLELLDTNKRPTASLGFVTNLIGCVVVAETIKLLTGMGKIHCYPREIYINLLNPRMKVQSARSVKRILLRLKQRFF